MIAANPSNLKVGDIVWVVNPQGVRLREQPDLKAPAPDVARFGAPLRVAEEPRVWRGTEQWLRVTTEDGRTFWIDPGLADTPFVSTDKPAAAFDVIVRDEPPGSVPKDGLNVRSDQHLDAPVIDRVRPGERLRVFVPDYQSDGSTWYGVQTPRSQIGWVLDPQSRWLQRLTEAPSSERLTKSAPPPGSFSVGGDTAGPTEEPSGAGRPAADVEPDYRFHLEVTNWSEHVVPKESVALNIVLQNRGDQRWVTGLNAPTSGQPVEVTYRIVRDNSVVAQERWPLDDSVEPGGEATLTRTLIAPEIPGDYLVFWDLEHQLTGEAFSEHGDGASKPLSLTVLDLPRVQRALDTRLPDDARGREELVKVAGEALLRPIDAALKQRLVDECLIPAVFDPASAKVARAALYGLYEARRIDSSIEVKLKAAFARRADEVSVLRGWLEGGRVRKEVLAWVQVLLPPPVKAPEPTDETVGPKKPIGTETTEEADLKKKIDQTGTSDTDRIIQQIIVTPPSQYYARPPDEHKVTVMVTREMVKLKCGAHEYASVQRLDSDELEAARLSSPETYGRLLFAGLFNDDRLPPYQDSTRVGFYKHVQGEADVIFELEIAPGEAALHTLKWEYLLPPDRAQPLAVFKQSPFFRRMVGQPPAAPPGWPLKVLVAIASPATLGLTRVNDKGFPVDEQGRPANRHVLGLKAIDVARERAIVTDALEQVAKFGAVQYTVLDGTRGQPVTLAALRQALQDEPFHILHLVAHGVLTDEGRFYLVLADEQGREDLVATDKFAAAPFGQLRLAVLDTCQSATLSLQGALYGLAPRLIEIGVPAVVAMQDQVPVPTAQRFTQWFYHHLARSGRIDMAMAATRLQLHDVDRRSWNWGIPVLMMSSDEGRLFEVSDEQVQQRQMPDTVPVKERYFPETGADDQALRTYLAGKAAQLGASPALVSTYSRWAAQPPSLPLLDPQKRRELTMTIDKPVDIKAGELQDFVTQQGAGDRRLQLDAEVFARIASALNAGKHIILIGPPGTGKTTLAQRIADFAVDRKCAGGHVLTTATADWTTFDTVGGYVPTQQQTLEFRPGVFLRAIREGQWLIIDEINRAEIDKAFGELFTLLSGQAVDLPYTVRNQPVRVRPPKSADPQDWIPDDLKNSLDDYQFVVHPTWRIIGTMNVYDKSYLFAMSFAFMRRFAFIDCDLPGEIEETDGAGQPIKRDLFAELIHDWLQREQLAALDLEAKLIDLINRNTALMKRRALGPAIIRDMLLFVKDRQGQANGASALSLLGEAILLYAVPQLDGLDREDILDIYKYLNGFLTSQPEDKTLAKVRGSVLDRIELLYPHIRPDEWKKARA